MRLNVMKNVKISLAAVLVFVAMTLQIFAVEVHISIDQGTNVVLSWFSHPGMDEHYYVQYCTNLLTDEWETLGTVPANASGNITTFTHTNIIPLAGDSGLIGGDRAAALSSARSPQSESAQILAMRKDGSGSVVPLMIYPPGMDLSAFNIIDTETGEQMDGAGLNRALSDPPLPPDGGTSSGDGISSFASSAGFYRVAQEGVVIYGMTNDMVLSGTVQFPIELGLDSTDQIVGIAFYDENKNPIIGAHAEGSNNCWTLIWDTTLSFNGSYNIYAAICYASDNSVASVPVTVTVSNIISFPYSFTQIFGSQMWVHAQSVPNATYRIDMYDQNTNYLGAFGGNTDGNGYISFIWTLQDRNGQLLTDTNFSGIFTVDTSSLSTSTMGMKMSSVGGKRSGTVRDFLNAPPPVKTLDSSLQTPKTVMASADSSSAQSLQKWSKEKPWSPGNGWAIAYSPLVSPTDSLTYYISQMMIGGNGGMYGGVVSTLGYYGMGYRLSPGNVSQTSAFQMGDENNKTNLLRYLSGNDVSGDYRHFYFFGHGSAVSFGCYSNPVVKAEEVSSNLLNKLPYSEYAPQHPYKLVIIQACETADGLLCESFGIPAQTVNNQYFQNIGIPSRAYLGYKDAIAFIPSNWQWSSMMLAGFFNDWMSGYTLQQCMDRAKAGYYISPGPTTSYMDKSAVIDGATDLTIFQ